MPDTAEQPQFLGEDDINKLIAQASELLRQTETGVLLNLRMILEQASDLPAVKTILQDLSAGLESLRQSSRDLVGQLQIPILKHEHYNVGLASLVELGDVTQNQLIVYDREMMRDLANVTKAGLAEEIGDGAANEVERALAKLGYSLPFRLANF